ncbi:ABC transporter substrate-binding protein [Kistimonas scapharcae]|uniref:ABC transporter substrate-binding protein n=1 Tax=Kistimonas scapharcae TaxID=1036133 RepID=A0ABP8UV21_9GAMM
MKMTQKLTRMLALLAVVAQVSLPVVAAEQKPETVASQATNQVLTVLRENRTVFEKEPQKYYVAVEEVLDPVIAFDQVARGVMGKYAHRATPEQLKAFTQTFRDSLIEFYGKAVMTLDPSRLKLSRVDPVAEEQLADYRNRKIRSIPVNLKVSSDNQEYSLSYSMIQDGGQWKARNIIVEGINIGVQFRNQFASAMQQYKDVGKVIDNWSAIMKNQADAAQGA